MTNQQFYITGAVAAAALYFLYSKGKSAANTLNPTSDQNIAYQGAKGLVDEIGGKGAFSNVADHVFGGLDLINPWAPEYRKQYAMQIYGIKE